VSGLLNKKFAFKYLELHLFLYAYKNLQIRLGFALGLSIRRPQSGVGEGGLVLGLNALID